MPLGLVLPRFYHDEWISTCHPSPDEFLRSLRIMNNCYRRAERPPSAPHATPPLSKWTVSLSYAMVQIHNSMQNIRVTSIASTRLKKNIQLHQRPRRVP